MIHLSTVKKLTFSSIVAVSLFSSSIDALTFFVPSDPHYGHRIFKDNEAVNKSAIDDMNQLPGTEYPDAEDGYVDYPEGVLVPGDLTSSGHLINWTGIWLLTWLDGFTTDYGVNGEGRIAFPVYEGYGNHDVKDRKGWFERWPIFDGIKDRNQHRATKVKLSDNELHYSWTWEGIHFVNLNLYPGGKGDAEYSLDFLIKDLKKRTAKDQPIILSFHYDLKTSERWWTHEERDTFYEAIKDYNVIGIFVGHSHSSKHYQWNGIDIYNAPSVKSKGVYFVVKIEDGKLVVHDRSPSGWGEKRWEKTFSHPDN